MPSTSRRAAPRTAQSRSRNALLARAAYQYGLQLIPSRAPQIESFEALELGATCGVTRPLGVPKPPTLKLPAASAAATYYVDYATGSDSASGSKSAPFKTLARGVKETRKTTSKGGAAALLLANGVHHLKSTIELGAADSALTISADPAASRSGTAPARPWISGGVPLAPAWTKWAGAANSSWNIWVTDVPAEVGHIVGLNTLAAPGGSGGTHSRLTRAREPSGDIEACVAEAQGKCWHNGMQRWHTDLSCVGKAKTVYIDLRHCADDGTLIGAPPGTPCKNNSAMWDTYNTYSNGHGGCCAAWSGDGSPYGPMGDYFCGNSSAGGWVGYMDPRMANHSQGLSPALPFGFDYNATVYPQLAAIADGSSIEGAVLHAWRAQGWFVNMFEVKSHDSDAHSMAFTRVATRDVNMFVECSFMYRYILRESCSQFDSLPLTCSRLRRALDGVHARRDAGRQHDGQGRVAGRSRLAGRPRRDAQRYRARLPAQPREVDDREREGGPRFTERMVVRSRRA